MDRKECGEIGESRRGTGRNIKETGVSYLVSSEEMKRYDRNTIEYFGVPSPVLMERAALAAAEEIEARCKTGKKVLVVAGCGNNGGDGVAVGRILLLDGYDVEICLIGSREKCSRETEMQLGIAEKYGCLIQNKIGDGEYDIIVDALFGIGLSRKLEGIYAEAVREINSKDAFVCALDIPSGIHADTGEVMGVAAAADLTVTFAFRKLGHILYPGCKYAGEVVCRQMGITEESFLGKKPRAYTRQGTACGLLPYREPGGNKGTFGKVLVVAGSRNMSGACKLCTESAYRAGAGMVKAVTPEENRLAVQLGVPEALLLPYPAWEEEGLSGQSREMEEKMREAFAWADAVVAGPGIGTGKEAERLLEWCLTQTEKPLVLDADAINLLAGREHLRLYLEEHRAAGRKLIMTPHVGEFARLYGCSAAEAKNGLAQKAKELADRYGCVMAAKDARTVVTCCGKDGWYVNTSGNDGMATAGMGDVLAGMIGGLLAQGMEAAEAAVVGVYIHGMAGDLAAEEMGRYSLTAGDVIRTLGAVIRI